MEAWEELLEAYSNEVDILAASYEMMGIMLNSRAVVSRFQERGISELYIYGGGFLGIQLFRAIYEDLNVISVVDKSGGLMTDVPQAIPVMDLTGFEQEYAGETVVVTPAKHFYAIQKDIKRFVPMEKILYLGELLGGVG